MPKAGMRELYACCLRKFGVRMVIGRDQCYNIFRANGLCQRVRRVRPKTIKSMQTVFRPYSSDRKGHVNPPFAGA